MQDENQNIEYKRIWSDEKNQDLFRNLRYKIPSSFQ